MLSWFKKSKDEEGKGEGSAVAGTPPQSGSDKTTSPARPNDKPPAGEQGFFGRLYRQLRKTRVQLVDRLRLAIGMGVVIDDEILEEIESILIEGDVGGRAAHKITSRIRKAGLRHYQGDKATAVIDLVKNAVSEILAVANRPISLDHPAPVVILIAGVNGTGKTTTIGKLALEFTNSGKKVMLVAADTFRAAAVDQLAIWAERTGAQIVRRPEGADPASVCFDALNEAKSSGADIVLIDTAGRLHTKAYLMDELSKVVRVVKKVIPDAPHETILVLDATTGQNALNQVATFKEVTGITGLIMTKLDGTAKGGILIAIKEAHPMPIFKIGIGEAPEDLRDFDPVQFTEALFPSEDTGEAENK